MLRRSVGCLPLARHRVCAAVTTVLAGPCRTFYEKVREEREGSDAGPEEMFADFPKNLNAQRVPQELRRGSKDAVDAAEKLNLAFLASIVAMIIGLGYFLDPFNEDQYQRPDKSVSRVEPTAKVPPTWAAASGR